MQLGLLEYHVISLGIDLRPHFGLGRSRLSCMRFDAYRSEKHGGRDIFLQAFFVQISFAKNRCNENRLFAYEPRSIETSSKKLQPDLTHAPMRVRANFASNRGGGGGVSPRDIRNYKT